MALIKKVELQLHNVNYEEVRFNDPVTISKDLGEVLDTGGFNALLEREEEIRPFTKCRVTDINDNISYWFANSKSEQITFDETSNLFDHKVFLVEPTKILERLYVGSKTFRNLLSGEAYTIYDVLNILRNTAPLRFKIEIDSDINAPFNIDPNIVDRLQSLSAREFTFTPDKFMLEILAEIGESIGAYPRMIDFETLTFDFYSDLDDLVEDGTYVAKVSDLAESQYHTNLVTNLQNVIPETLGGASSIQSIYTTPRNNSGQRISTTDGMFIQLDRPIYKKFPNLRATNFTVRYDYPPNTNIETTFSTVGGLDISNYLYEKTEYDTLTLQEKGTAIYYTQDGDRIEGLTFQPPAFLNLSEFAIVEILKRVAEIQLRQFVPDPQFLVVKTLVTNVEDIAFQTEYSPTTSILTKKPKLLYAQHFNQDGTPKNKLNLDLMFNQNTNIVDAISFGDALNDKSARMGVSEYSKTYVFEDINDLKPLGSFNSDNYFVDRYDAEYWNDYVIQTVTYSNDYVRLSEFIGVDSLNRQSAVPQSGDIVERKLHYQEYAILSDTYLGSGNPAIGITTNAINRIGGVFNPIATRTTDNSPVSFTTVRPREDTATATGLHILNVSSIGMGDFIHLNFKMEDNYSAGLTTTLDGGDRYSKGHPYSSTVGRAKYLGFAMYSRDGMPDNSTDLQDIAYIYPNYAENAPDFGQHSFTPNTDPDIYFAYENQETARLFEINKDSAETINFNYQISFLTDNPNKNLIGSALTEENTLVSDTSDKELYVWLLDYRVGKLNKRKLDTTQATMQPHSLFVTEHTKYIEALDTIKAGVIKVKQVTATPPTTHTAWAIADADGNIYLAVNEPLNSGNAGDTIATKYINYIKEI